MLTVQVSLSQFRQRLQVTLPASGVTENLVGSFAALGGEHAGSNPPPGGRAGVVERRAAHDRAHRLGHPGILLGDPPSVLGEGVHAATAALGVIAERAAW